MDRAQQELLQEVKALRAAVASLQEEKRERQSGKLARVILDEMYQFVALLDREGNILEVNKTALDGAGIQLRDVAGTPFWTARWWAVSESVQKELQQAVIQAAQGEFVRYEVEIFGGASGKELIWIDFSIIPVKDAAGKILYLLAEGRNITEKKRAEAEITRKNEELKVLYEKLKEFDQLKTQFFANVSHELRTPLALILAPIREVLRSNALSQEELFNLEVVERNARVLLKQVNDLLDVARLEAGKMAANYQRADLAQLFRLVASNFEIIAKEKLIDYQVKVPNTLWGEFDAGKMQRVLLNLLSNAFKFTPTGGKIRCSLEENQQRAILAVADSGPGVKAEHREIIFERFRQIEGGTTRKFGGTGLGLAIVKDLVALQGGSIRVEEASQGGARFIIDLPLTAPSGTVVHSGTDLEDTTLEEMASPVVEEIRPRENSPVHSSPDEAAPLIVVVEDNADLNRFLTKTLSSHYRVVSAMDGQEGLDLALEVRPDLILCDVMMPRMSGDQMVEELRKHASLQSVPILMLTAKADDSLKVKMLSGKVEDYLIKPFYPEEVKARVKNLVTMKKARQVLQKELDSKSEDLSSLVAETLRVKHQLEQTNTQLQRINHDLESFVYSASHDLRAPIANLEGIHRQLSKRLQGKVDETGVQMLEMMNSSILKLKRTISDLAEITRIQKLEEPPQVLLFKRVLQEVGRDIAPMVSESGAQLKLELGVESILYQPTHLRSILYNLLSNAIKFRSPDRVLCITVKTWQEEEGIGLAVSDNGLGLKAEQISKLFQLFKRLHTHGEGTGIGLYMTRRIVENNWGRIWCESELGKGSTFQIYFKQ